MGVCNRYYLDLDPGEGAEELRELMAELNRRQLDEKAPAAFVRGEVRPRDVAAVIASEGPRAMRWGFVRPDGVLVTNARSETVEEVPMFRAARRCVVPASRYFEWAHRGSAKIKYSIGLADRPIFMAGLYRAEGGANAFCVLTRAPAPEIAFIHDRMPVLLPYGARRAWLDGAPARSVLPAALTDVRFERSDGQIGFFPEI